KFVNDLPRIAGVANNANYPPQIGFSDGFAQFGQSAGINDGNVTTRPAYVFNDLVSWVKGKHTFKFGGEYRNIGQNFHSDGNESGTLNFTRGATAVRGVVDRRNAIASFRVE